MGWASAISSFTLKPEDLKRFSRFILSDLAEFLPDYDFKLTWTPSDLEEEGLEVLPLDAQEDDEESGSFSLPLIYRGRFLAQISACLKPGRPPANPALVELTPLILQQILEKLLLYKAQVLDRETGLYSRDYFYRQLVRRIKKEAQAQIGRQQQGLALGDEQLGLVAALVELKGFGRLSGEYGRVGAKEALRILAGWLREKGQGPRIIARVSPDRLGLIFNDCSLGQMETWAERVLERARTEQRQTLVGSWPLLPVLGWAGYPQDFSPEDKTEQIKSETLAEALITKARLALMNALGRPGPAAQSFSQLLKRGGQVVQTLPGDRVVLNLGRSVGARSGQVFLISEGLKNQNLGSGDLDYKGEAVIFETADDYSIAHTKTASSGAWIAAGDHLVLSRQLETPSEEIQISENCDPLLGILDYQGFLAAYTRAVEKEERAALVMVRLDGYEQLRSNMGQQESDRRLLEIYQALTSHIPPGAVVGRPQAAVLAVYLPGLEEEAALNWSQELAAMTAEGEKPLVSAGVAVFPKGPLTKADLPASAQKALEHAAFLGPAQVVAFSGLSLNLSGDRRFEAGDLAGAMAEYRLGLALAPDDFNLLNSLGVCIGQSGDLSEALDIFEGILEKAPDNLMANYNRGYTLALAGRLKEAYKAFERAASLSPDNFDCLFHLGKSLLELGEIPEALAALLKAARLPHSRPVVYRFLGQAYWRLGDEQAAFESFKKAVKADPGDAFSLSALGQLFAQKETDPEVARSLLRKSVELDPTNSLYRHRLGRLLLARGENEAAEAELLKALEYGGKSPEIFYGLGRAAEAQERYAEARERYAEALAKDSGYQRARAALAALEGRPA